MDIKNFDLRIFVTEENLPNSDIPLYALTAYDGETGDVKIPFGKWKDFVDDMRYECII